MERIAVRTPAELARAARAALLMELAVTPKPGLVDLEHRGSHADLCADRMRASAHALEATFASLARSAEAALPSRELREEIGALGRAGERAMLRASGGSNTHRGALWALGLLVAGAASLPLHDRQPARIAMRAGALAGLPDRFARRAPRQQHTNGAIVKRRYGFGGAVAEATANFPSVMHVALPLLRRRVCEADVLLALIAHVDDTCILHRVGPVAARSAQHGARRALHAGGNATPAGRLAVRRLDAAFLARNISPGGCADLLAAAIFLTAFDG